MEERDPWMRHMRRGEFARAWRISDAVLRNRGGRTGAHLPRHLQPVWDGSPLHGRRVLVRCYHGLGDTVQFARFLRPLRDVAREVVLWVQPALVRLFEGFDGVDRILPLHDGDPGVAYDVDVEIMELAYAFRVTERTLPAAVPYIHVPPAPLALGRPAVGVAWRGGDWDERRRIPFGRVRELVQAAPQASWVSLQPSRGDDERDDRIRDVLDPAGDVLATARIMRRLDLVVSVDTLVAHLGGALGLPTWTLLHAEPDWRWMADRADTPWYPTMRLFRQAERGDWRSVVRAVASQTGGGRFRFHEEEGS